MQAPLRRSFLTSHYHYVMLLIISPSIAGQKLGVEKRYLHHTEELIRAHPEFLDDEASSVDARLDICATAVPELAAEASRKAIAEWGRPAADITHLVVTTNSGAHIPGVDFRLIALL